MVEVVDVVKNVISFINSCKVIHVVRGDDVIVVSRLISLRCSTTFGNICMSLIHLLNEVVRPVGIVICNIRNRLEILLYDCNLRIGQWGGDQQTTIGFVGVCPLVSISILYTSKGTRAKAPVLISSRCTKAS